MSVAPRLSVAAFHAGRARTRAGVCLLALALGLCGVASARSPGRRGAPPTIVEIDGQRRGRLRQPVHSLRKLYRMSRRSLGLYQRTMSRHAARLGAELVVAPLKSRARSREKMQAQLGGDAASLTDVVRGTLVFRSFQDLYRGLEELKANERVVQVKDYVQNPGLGFPHVNVRLRLANDLIVETQLTTRPYFDAYHGPGGIHVLYERYRALRERPSPTAKDRRELDSLVTEMRRRFARVKRPD